jgi:hypothetical protein
VLAIVFIVVLPALYAGLLFMIKELIEKHDGSLKTMIAGIIRFGARAVLISIFYFVSGLCLLISMVYYGIVSHGVFPFGFLVVGVAAFWALVFLVLTAIAVFPVLVNKDAGIVETIRTACLLVLDNPVFFAGLALSLAFVIAFSIMPPVAMFAAVAFFAAIVGSAYEMLARKYAALQDQPAMPDGPKKKIAIDFGDGNDEYLSRGLRDFLFPWKE